MEEIKIGEYVRTKKGKIAKVRTIYSEEDRIKMKNFSVKKETLINGNIKIPDVVKHSFNIKDLIKEGDYINGKYIESILSIDYEDSKHNKLNTTFFIYDKRRFVRGAWQGVAFIESEIKSIVTKEQFESVKYEVIK